jgi:hypothetical protein
MSTGLPWSGNAEGGGGRGVKKSSYNLAVGNECVRSLTCLLTHQGLANGRTWTSATRALTKGTIQNFKIRAGLKAQVRPSQLKQLTRSTNLEAPVSSSAKTEIRVLIKAS